MNEIFYQGKRIAISATLPGEVDMIAVGLSKGLQTRNLNLWDCIDLKLEKAFFSLVCAACSADALDGINTKEQALSAGWREIEFVPLIHDRNYEGTCPHCVKESVQSEKSVDKSPEVRS
jgi:hypothetical protein